MLPLNEAVQQLETLPVPVVAYGRELAQGDILPWHEHRRAQLVYASSGVMTVLTPGTAHAVPPHRAVWVPGSTAHQIEARSKVSMRTLYVDRAHSADVGSSSDLGAQVCVLEVSTLLRELILEAVAGGTDYGPNSSQARIMAVILDQISAQPRAKLAALPMPGESRLQHIVDALLDAPGDNRDLDDWAKTIGASKRTITRLFTQETGLTFRAWRQQLRAHRALELLAGGQSVTSTALDLGYENTSAFIAMFKRCVGTTPMQYVRNA